MAIVADDLTGAMDAGVQVAKRGLHAVVMLGEGDLPAAEAIVLSTGSRDTLATEAYGRARRAAERVRGRTVYKKVDSTLRGHIGPEVDGLLDGLGLKRALVAPAFPATGRTVVDGCQRVNGVLLAESAFAHDPLWPAAVSHVPTLLGRQTRRSVGHLGLSVVERGVEAVAAALEAEAADIVVADAVGAGHLSTLARGLACLREPWLPCGSAGLAEAWAGALGVGWEEGAPFRWRPRAGPVLVLAGSRNPATARQLQRAAAGGLARLVGVSPGQAWERAAGEALGLLKQGLSVALTTTFSEYRAGESGTVAQMLAAAATWLLGRAAVSGLFVTGGDVARAACGALGARALGIVGEVQAGGPAGTLLGGLHDGLRIVSKAGGFGSDEAIIESIRFVQGG